MEDKFYKRPAYYFWDKQVSKVGKPVAYMLVNTKVTPNMLTIFNFIVIFPLICLVSHLKMTFLVVILLNLYLELDIMDGGLARLKDMHSSFGAKLDIVSDYFMYLIGFIFIAVFMDTSLAHIIFSLTAQWLYALITTIYIAPMIRKLKTFKKTKIKIYFEEQLHWLFGMAVSTQILLISIFVFTPWKRYVFAFCGVLWLFDLVFRLLELHVLNSEEIKGLRKRVD